MRKPLQFAGLVVCLAAGILLATAVVGSVRAATTTETTTEPTTETTTEPTTVVTTATVQQTTTRKIILPSPTTTSSDTGSSSDTPTWVWVLLGILAVALVILIVLFARRGGGAAPSSAGAFSPAQRHQRLDGAIASWTAQGWALESQSADAAVLQRGSERMLVSVDAAGQVSTQAYPAAPPA